MRKSLQQDATQYEIFQEDNLYKVFNDIHNFIYANDGKSKESIFDEIVKILYMKISDEMNNDDELFFITDDEYNSVVDNTSSTFETRIHDLFVSTSVAYQNIFTKSDSLKLSAISLAYTVNALQKFRLTEQSNDANGLAFQKFLNRQDKGDRGQYFTPQPVIDFCVEMIAPKSNERVIDPACGSGGFLYSALKYICNNEPIIDINEYIVKCIYGADIDNRIAKITEMRFILESNSTPNILCMNSLDAFSKDKILKQNNYDIILTNPPFGSQGKISSKSILKNYDLGHKWEFDKIKSKYVMTSIIQDSQVPDVLFIELCIRLLKNGGRMAIVLPNGHFENPTFEYVREFIRSNTKLLAVVSLPQETFVPYGTAIKASLLFLQKCTELHVDNRTFFGRINKLGYQGNKNGSSVYKTDTSGYAINDEEGNLILDEDMTLVVDDYQRFCREEPTKEKTSFSVLSANLDRRFDYNYHDPELVKISNTLEHADAYKLNELCSVVSKRSEKLRDRNAVFKYIELSDINTFYSEISRYELIECHALPSRATYEVLEGDIITAVSGNSIGTDNHATAIVTRDYDMSIVSNGFKVIRNLTIDPYFLIYFFRTELFLKQVFRLRTGAAIPTISDSDFSNIFIYIPPIEVYDRICKSIKESFKLREKSRFIFEEALKVRLL